MPRQARKSASQVASPSTNGRENKPDIDRPAVLRGHCINQRIVCRSKQTLRHHLVAPRPHFHGRPPVRALAAAARITSSAGDATLTISSSGLECAGLHHIGRLFPCSLPRYLLRRSPTGSIVRNFNSTRLRTTVTRAKPINSRSSISAAAFAAQIGRYGDIGGKAARRGQSWP
tara:strand:- start:10178 stop:10696 length:519 start_codon:yes stop_codon:yes gene_type:complete